MKKIEIIELIEKKKKLYNIKHKLEKFKTYGIKWYFPECEELKKEFDILEKELIEDEKIFEKLSLELSQKCEHKIRLRYCGHHPEFNKCVFCDEVFYVRDDNNDPYISFYSAIQDGYDNFDSEEINIGELHIVNPYYDYHIINIIEYILKDKNDYDDIDLIDEMNKLDLPYKKVHNNLYLSLKK